MIPLCRQEPTGACIISGWGSIDPSGRSGTDQLQKLYQNVTPRSTCERNYGRGRITPAMICVGGQSGQGGCMCFVVFVVHRVKKVTDSFFCLLRQRRFRWSNGM